MNITKRLQNAMREGNLSVSDLSRWLGRSYATVRGWTRGTDMSGTEGDQAVVLDRLKLIERRIKTGAGLPVPQFKNGGRMRAPTMRLAYLNQLMARKKL